MNKKKLVVVAGDAHIPFADSQALQLFYSYIKACQPQTIILNGDWIDCYEISKFRKVPITQAEFSNEIEMGRKSLEEIRNAVPKARIIYIEGNHEMRLKKYLVERAPELYKLFLGGSQVLMEYLLNCHKYKIEYKPVREELDKFAHNYIEIAEGVYVGHFDKVAKNAGYTARILRDELGANIIQSHTHRIGYSAKTYIDSIKYGMEIGCLSSKPTFLNNADWALGWLIAYIDSNGNFFPYQIGPLQDYSFIAPDGTKYSA